MLSAAAIPVGARILAGCLTGNECARTSRAGDFACCGTRGTVRLRGAGGQEGVLTPSCGSPPPGDVCGCPRPQTNFIHILWKNLFAITSRRFCLAPDPGGGGAVDVWLAPAVCIKATLRPGAGMRAREARLLGQQPAFAYPLGQPGGNTKASLTFARAARPEGRGGDSQEAGGTLVPPPLVCLRRIAALQPVKNWYMRLPYTAAPFPGALRRKPDSYAHRPVSISPKIEQYSRHRTATHCPG